MYEFSLVNTIHSPVDYLKGIWNHIEDFGYEIESMSLFFLEISTASYNFTKIQPCVVAVSAVILSFYCFGIYRTSNLPEDFISSKCIKLLWDIANETSNPVALVKERYPTETNKLSYVDTVAIESIIHLAN